MSNVPPRRTGQSSSQGGAPRNSQSGQPARSNRPAAPRQPQRYAEDDFDEGYEEYEERPRRSQSQGQSQRQPSRSGPPPRGAQQRGGQQRYSGQPPRSSGTYRRPPPRYVEQRRDMFPIMMGGLIGMAVVGIMVILFLVLNQKPSISSPPVTDVTTQPTMGQSSMGASGLQTMEALRPADGIGTAVPDEGNTHVDEGTVITYKSYPPSSGTHYGATADYGFSEAIIPEGKLVHSLEHGAVVLYYKSSVGTEVLQQLRDTYNKLPAGKYGKVKLVIAPYENMSTPLAIAAWDRLYLMNAYNFDEIQTFYSTWVDKGPEDVP